MTHVFWVGEMCNEEGVKEGKLRSGGKRSEITRVRRKIAYYLSNEVGILMAEIRGRHVSNRDGNRENRGQRKIVMFLDNSP